MVGDNMTTNTGGSAFPTLKAKKVESNYGGVYVDQYEAIGGLSIRDYFAIRAFQTRLAKHNDWTLTELTEQSYADADAMLKARG
jgi:hypothetical protein